MEIVVPAHVERRQAQSYLGIRVVTPFRGMLKVRNDLQAELARWTHAHDVATRGFGLFRLHVIDMEGPMELEVAVLVDCPPEGDDRVRPGELPAGDYATFTFRDHARRAHGFLIDWASDNGLRFDQHRVAAGDAFACRYEAYLTDPRTEPRRTRWDVELAIKLA
ncbi:MAG TPA: GyrI-like domain-containing protein [Gaiellaceae bacterium]|nr:GyrI-like domain-containing protein [Gaiellaceae bacterium]